MNRELQQHKRHHQRLKARWESERARSVVLSNDELTAAKAQVEDLKRAIRQIRREKLMQVVLRCSVATRVDEILSVCGMNKIGTEQSST